MRGTRRGKSKYAAWRGGGSRLVAFAPGRRRKTAGRAIRRANGRAAGEHVRRVRARGARTRHRAPSRPELLHVAAGGLERVDVRSGGRVVLAPALLDDGAHRAAAAHVHVRAVRVEELPRLGRVLGAREHVLHVALGRALAREREPQAHVARALEVLELLAVEEVEPALLAPEVEHRLAVVARAARGARAGPRARATTATVRCTEPPCAARDD